MIYGEPRSALSRQAGLPDVFIAIDSHTLRVFCIHPRGLANLEILGKREHQRCPERSYQVVLRTS